MNYIYEINAFYDWVETNPLTSSAIALWHALLHIANKTGWQNEFAVSISVLQYKTGLNAKSIERARNLLSQNGLVKWKSRKGNQSAVYTLMSLCDKNTCKNVAQPVAQSVVQCVAQPVAQSVAINKQNKTKQKKENIKEKIESYTENDQLREALYGYVEMRKEEKKPPTSHAFDLVLKKLDSLSAEKDGSDSYKIAILEMSILKGWTDVYAVDDYQPQKPERDQAQDDTLQHLSAEYESKLHQHLVDGGSPFDFPSIEEMYPEYWRDSQ